MTRNLARSLQGGGTYIRLSLVAVLLCAISGTEELHGQSWGAAATRFRPVGEAVAHHQHGRRLHAADLQKGTSESKTQGGQDNADLQQEKLPKAAKAAFVVPLPESVSSDLTITARAAAADRAGDAAVQRIPAGGADQSATGLYNLQQRSDRQPGDAAAVPANTKGSVLVSQLLRGDSRLPQASGVPRSAEATVSPATDAQPFVYAQSQERNSDVIVTPTPEEGAPSLPEELPAGTTKGSAALEDAGAETAAPAVVTGDQGSAGIEPAAPSYGPLPSEEEKESRLPAEAGWQLLGPPPTSKADAGTRTSPQAHSTSVGGSALEAASKWEELSRQHQQILLSRNLTSVVKLFVDFTQPDHVTPWQMHPPRRCTGSAFVVEGRLLLTSAHLVDWQTRVLARRHGNARKFTASVVAVGHDCDLALLTVDNEEFWEGLHPPAFGQVPQLRDTVTLLGYPTGGDQLSITEGVVSRVGMSKYSHSSHELLTVQIDAAVNPGNSGGPALVHGKVVGIAFQGFSDLQSIGYIVPYPVIRHFLNDLALHQRFTGFPTLGIKVANLENQGMKEYKKLTSVKPGDLPEGITPSGVIVVEVDNLRKERYLSGLLRLPYASSVLPQGVRITQLLPEDPSQPSTPAPVSGQQSSLHLHYLAAITPETAVSYASLYPPLGVGTTVFLPAYPAPGGAAPVPDTFEPLVAFPGTGSSGASPMPSQPSGDTRGQQAEEYDLQELQNDLDANEQHFEDSKKQKKAALTSENDLIAPNVHFNPQHAFDIDHVGLQVGDVLLAVDGVGECALTHLRKEVERTEGSTAGGASADQENAHEVETVNTLKS